MIYLFCVLVLESHLIGFFSLFSIFFSKSLFRDHVFLTGDLDSFLVLFILVYTLSFFTILSDKFREQKNLFLLLFGLGFLLAYFSKSTASLLPLPGIFLVAFQAKRFREIFFSRIMILTMVSGVGLIGLYYFYMDSVFPGYWDKVFFSEFSRIYDNIMPWHNKPFHFYLKNWVVRGFYFPYLIFCLFAIPLAYFTAKKERTLFSIRATIYVVSFIIIISIPTIKLEWYDAPVFPMLSILFGISAASGFELVQKRFKVIYYILFVLVFILPDKSSIVYFLEERK
ncbi:MAG: hypothetical protein R2879_09765 [Saprospiraceae bacterium]